MLVSEFFQFLHQNSNGGVFTQKSDWCEALKILEFYASHALEITPSKSPLLYIGKTCRSYRRKEKYHFLLLLLDFAGTALLVTLTLNGRVTHVFDFKYKFATKIAVVE